MGLRQSFCFRNGKARYVRQMEVDIDRLADVWSVRKRDVDDHPRPYAAQAIGAEFKNLSVGS